MNSTQLKTMAMCWLRFGRRMPYVCSEYGAFHADVIGANDTECVEIETKISRQDLRAEKGKTKHRHYADKWLDENTSIPNRYYILVPECIGADAIKIAEELNPAYGVMILSADFNYTAYSCHKALKILKRAKPIHKNKPHENKLYDIAERMSSEICGWHMSRVFDQILWANIKHLRNTPDYEISQSDQSASTTASTLPGQ